MTLQPERCPNDLVVQLLWDDIAALENEMSQLQENGLELVTCCSDRGSNTTGYCLSTQNILSAVVIPEFAAVRKG